MNTLDMKPQAHISTFIRLAIGFAALTMLAKAAPIVIDFEDRPKENTYLAGPYNGIQFNYMVQTGDWFNIYSGADYSTAVIVPYLGQATLSISFEKSIYYHGLDLISIGAPAGPTSFSLYNKGALVGEYPGAPSAYVWGEYLFGTTWQPSGYHGLIDEVRISSYFYGIHLDNITYEEPAKSSVPDTTSTLGLISLLALVTCVAKRVRKVSP